MHMEDWRHTVQFKDHCKWKWEGAIFTQPSTSLFRLTLLWLWNILK
jgi:hypothetical protein